MSGDLIGMQLNNLRKHEFCIYYYYDYYYNLFIAAIYVEKVNPYLIKKKEII